MSCKAVIFDLDGVLVSTSELHYKAWKFIAAKQGVPFGREDNEKFKGVSRKDCVRMLFPNEEDDGVLQNLANEKNDYYCELVNTLTPQDVFPGTRELIEDLKAYGIKTAIGSVSKNTSAVLNKLEIKELFDAIIDGNCVKFSKPSPDVFLYAAGRLNVHPENNVVVEDSAAGIEAACTAGMKTIGIGSCNILSKANFVVDRIGELTLQSFEKLY